MHCGGGVSPASLDLAGKTRPPRGRPTKQVQEGQLIGSWSPDHPTRDRWGHAGGRLYMTAMNLLMLEVYYRHMPLFREL